MARGRKKKDIVAEEVQVETPVAEEVTTPETPAEEVQVESTEVVEEPVPAAEEKQEEIATEDLPKVDDAASEFVEEPAPAPEPVVPAVDSKKDYNTNISKIIAELKKNKVYKFLSKVALIKIAGDILNNKHLWK